jgi:hypothetical protein
MMNDFTKEELELLSAMIHHSMCCHDHEDGKALRDKVQSMIDNYCICTNTDNYTDTIIKCVKCCKVKVHDNE